MKNLNQIIDSAKQYQQQSQKIHTQIIRNFSDAYKISQIKDIITKHRNKQQKNFIKLCLQASDYYTASSQYLNKNQSPDQRINVEFNKISKFIVTQSILLIKKCQQFQQVITTQRNKKIIQQSLGIFRRIQQFFNQRFKQLQYQMKQESKQQINTNMEDYFLYGILKQTRKYSQHMLLLLKTLQLQTNAEYNVFELGKKFNKISQQQKQNLNKFIKQKLSDTRIQLNNNPQNYLQKYVSSLQKLLVQVDKIFYNNNKLVQNPSQSQINKNIQTVVGRYSIGNRLISKGCQLFNMLLNIPRMNFLQSKTKTITVSAENNLKQVQKKLIQKDVIRKEQIKMNADIKEKQMENITIYNTAILQQKHKNFAIYAPKNSKIIQKYLNQKKANQLIDIGQNVINQLIQHYNNQTTSYFNSFRFTKKKLTQSIQNNNHLKTALQVYQNDMQLCRKKNNQFHNIVASKLDTIQDQQQWKKKFLKSVSYIQNQKIQNLKRLKKINLQVMNFTDQNLKQNSNKILELHLAFILKESGKLQQSIRNVFPQCDFNNIQKYSILSQSKLNQKIRQSSHLVKELEDKKKVFYQNFQIQQINKQINKQIQKIYLSQINQNVNVIKSQVQQMNKILFELNKTSQKNGLQISNIQENWKKDKQLFIKKLEQISQNYNKQTFKNELKMIMLQQISQFKKLFSKPNLNLQKKENKQVNIFFKQFVKSLFSIRDIYNNGTLQESTQYKQILQQFTIFVNSSDNFLSQQFEQVLSNQVVKIINKTINENQIIRNKKNKQIAKFKNQIKQLKKKLLQQSYQHQKIQQLNDKLEIRLKQSEKQQYNSDQFIRKLQEMRSITLKQLNQIEIRNKQQLKLQSQQKLERIKQINNLRQLLNCQRNEKIERYQQLIKMKQIQIYNLQRRLYLNSNPHLKPNEIDDFNFNNQERKTMQTKLVKNIQEKQNLKKEKQILIKQVMQKQQKIIYFNNQNLQLKANNLRINEQKAIAIFKFQELIKNRRLNQANYIKIIQNFKLAFGVQQANEQHILRQFQEYKKLKQLWKEKQLQVVVANIKSNKLAQQIQQLKKIINSQKNNIQEAKNLQQQQKNKQINDSNKLKIEILQKSRNEAIQNLRITQQQLGKKKKQLEVLNQKIIIYQKDIRQCIELLKLQQQGMQKMVLNLNSTWDNNIEIQQYKNIKNQINQYMAFIKTSYNIKRINQYQSKLSQLFMRKAQIQKTFYQKKSQNFQTINLNNQTFIKNKFSQLKQYVKNIQQKNKRSYQHLSKHYTKFQCFKKTFIFGITKIIQFFQRSKKSLANLKSKFNLDNQSIVGKLLENLIRILNNGFYLIQQLMQNSFKCIFQAEHNKIKSEIDKMFKQFVIKEQDKYLLNDFNSIWSKPFDKQFDNYFQNQNEQLNENYKFQLTDINL